MWCMRSLSVVLLHDNHLKMASYEGRNMSWSWRAHNKAYLRIVANEGFVLWFDNTRNRMHILTVKILYCSLLNLIILDMLVSWKYLYSFPNTSVPENNFFCEVQLSVACRNTARDLQSHSEYVCFESWPYYRLQNIIKTTTTKNKSATRLSYYAFMFWT
jgi:hypothetical protein